MAKKVRLSSRLTTSAPIRIKSARTCQKTGDMLVLGTDGYGRSDTREALRRHFEVNRYHVVVAALKSLADQGKATAADVKKAIDKYGIDTEDKYPLYR